MTNKRKGVPQAMGLSALDLITGLFGMIVLLYAFTSLDDGYPEPFEQTIYFISIEVKKKEAHLVGLSFEANGIKYESWPKCHNDGPVRWITCEPGLLEVAIEGTAPENELWVGILKPIKTNKPIAKYPDIISVRVTTRDGEKTVDLSVNEFYRKVIII